MSEPRKDDVTGRQTTGHEWDGIEELNTPLPRWWLWVFYATILWSVGYWVLMPAWPMMSDYTKGWLGYSQREVVAARLAEARAAQAPMNARVASLSLDAIREDASLLDFAIRGGRSAFAVNCSQCHGSGAAGSKGYPNLNDDDWLWGGTLAEIEQTIRVGIRSAHPDTRVNAMPAFGRDGMLTADQVGDMVDYVLALSAPAQNGVVSGSAARLFADNCAACHGDEGRGKPDMGAPNLTDGIWLYGGAREEVFATLQGGRGGVMPHWQGRLDDATIKKLAIYVHALGGGK